MNKIAQRQTKQKEKRKKKKRQIPKKRKRQILKKGGRKRGSENGQGVVDEFSDRRDALRQEREK